MGQPSLCVRGDRTLGLGGGFPTGRAGCEAPEGKKELYKLDTRVGLGMSPGPPGAVPLADAFWELGLRDAAHQSQGDNTR